MIIAFLIFIPLIAACITIVLPRTHTGERAIGSIAMAAAGVEALLAGMIALNTITDVPPSAGSFLMSDALGAFVTLITALVGFAAAMQSVGHLQAERRKDIIGFSRVKQYFVLFHLFFCAMYLASLATHPLLTWIAIEATTLATAFLTTFYNKDSSLEAGWKQLIINSVGLLLGLLGTLLFMSAASGTENASSFITWSALNSLAGTLNPLLVKIAFVFVIIGYGTKVGFVPLHTWKPDAYSKAPAPISALFSGALASVAFIALLRFQHITSLAIGPAFPHTLLVGFGVISIVIAALLMTAPKNYKRLLAYSSIEHGGVMALGFGIGGAGTLAALFHMFYHALAKPLLFFSAGNIFLTFSSTKIVNVRGALSVIPFSALAFMGGIMAATGMPPFGIFFTKLAILGATLDTSPTLAVIVLVAFAIVFANLIRHAVSMVFGEAPDGIEKGEAGIYTVLPIAFLALIFVTVSLWTPDALAHLITQSALLIN